MRLTSRLIVREHLQSSVLDKKGNSSQHILGGGLIPMSYFFDICLTLIFVLSMFG